MIFQDWPTRIGSSSSARRHLPSSAFNGQLKTAWSAQTGRTFASTHTHDSGTPLLLLACKKDGSPEGATVSADPKAPAAISNPNLSVFVCRLCFFPFLGFPPGI